jgi:hypothetical protein
MYLRFDLQSLGGCTAAVCPTNHHGTVMAIRVNHRSFSGKSDTAELGLDRAIGL